MDNLLGEHGPTFGQIPDRRGGRGRHIQRNQTQRNNQEPVQTPIAKLRGKFMQLVTPLILTKGVVPSENDEANPEEPFPSSPFE